MDEAEVEHLVGLVEDEIADGGQADRLAGNEVQQAAGRCDEDVGALFQHLLLLVDGCAADHRIDLQRHATDISLQVDGDLVHQFASRCEDQSTRRAVVGTLGVLRQHLDERQAEGGRLAGAGLGETNEVAALEKMRDSLSLDRRRSVVAQGGKVGYELLGEAKLMEIRQVEYLFGAPKAHDRLRHHAVRFALGVKNPA